MTQFRASIQEDIKVKSSFEQKLIDEQMNKVDKYSIMNETLTFNNYKLSNENSRIILVKLIYLVNQGMQFSELEIEQLFFRITKLFQSNNSKLREMTYRTIKMIMPQKYVHMLIQCLTKDLMSDNPQIRLQALKFIPFIQSEQYIHQIERFVHNALIDPDLLISSTALIVGIHIVNKFPNLVSKWLFEVVQNIDQLHENIGYHALILFHEIKKNNLSQFIKIIIKLTKRQLQSLLHFQIIKFIQEVLKQSENAHKKEFISYLLQQIDNKDPLTAFQSCKILINNFEVQNNELVSVQKYIEEHLQSQINNNEIYRALKLMHFIVTSNKRKQLITQQQILLITALSFNYRVTLSKIAILFFIYSNSSYSGVDLKNLFDVESRSISQTSFLNGIQEIIIYYPNHLKLVLEFLNCAFSCDRENELVELAIKLVVQIIRVQKQFLQQAYPVLFILADNPGLKNKSNAIKIINRVLLNIQSTRLDYQNLKYWFQYLKESEPIEINEKQINFLRNQYIRLENYSSQLTQKRAQLKKKQANNNLKAN